MKPIYQILSLISFLFIVSSGALYALNGVESFKLPWQGIASTFYDPTHNVGSSNIIDTNRFTFTGSNTVAIDNVTGLQWQSYYVSLSATTYTWSNARIYCSGLTLGGYTAGTWRLPAVKELASIADSSFSPGVNTNYFQGQAAWYWSSTPVASDTLSAYLVSNNGDISSALKSTASTYYARCVHN